MAKTKTVNAPASGGAPKPKGVLRRILTLSLVLFIGMLFLPTVLFLFVAMLPTSVAFVAGLGKKKRYDWICIGGLNFAGASPFLLTLWTGRNTVEAAFDELASVFNLMAIYGSAALGWLLFIAMPPIMVVFMQMSAQHRIGVLKQTQAHLVQIWGAEVGKAKAAPAKPGGA